MGGGNFQKIEIGPLRENEEKSYYLYNLSSAHFVVYSKIQTLGNRTRQTHHYDRQYRI